MTTKKRNIIAIGKTGVGKSFILCQLLGINKEEKVFESNNLTTSCTDTIQKATRSVHIDNEVYEFTVYDTPGLSDTQGRTQIFLDQIMSTIRSNNFHQILIFIEYTRFSIDLQQCLDTLHHCLNPDGQALTNAVCTLVINKVPSEQSFIREAPNLREREIENMIKRVNRFLKTNFCGSVAIVKLSDEVDGNEMAFRAKIDELRRLIAARDEMFDSERVKTWTECDAKSNKVDKKEEEKTVNKSLPTELCDAMQIDNYNRKKTRCVIM